MRSRYRWLTGAGSGLTHRVRELVDVQVVAGVDGGLTFAVSGQQLRIGEHRDRLLQRVVVISGQQHSGSASVAGDLEALVGGHRRSTWTGAIVRPLLEEWSCT
jgi:hypothetical protein